MRKMIVIAVIAVVLAGCAKDGRQVEPKGATSDFDVSLLFEVDGVKVYRFYDAGYWRYFASRGETFTSISNGKTTHPDGLVTVEAP